MFVIRYIQESGFQPYRPHDAPRHYGRAKSKTLLYNAPLANREHKEKLFWSRLIGITSN
jgi:hypothetical protein